MTHAPLILKLCKCLLVMMVGLNALWKYTHAHINAYMMILENKEECYDMTRNFGEFLRNRKRWNQAGNKNHRPKHVQVRTL